MIVLSRSPLVHTEDHPAPLRSVPSPEADGPETWTLVSHQLDPMATCMARPVVGNLRQPRRPCGDRPVGTWTVDQPASVADASTTPLTLWLASAGALAYCSWPLAFLVNPSLAGNGLASSFEAPGQPFSWLFILLDCIAGLCIAVVSLRALSSHADTSGRDGRSRSSCSATQRSGWRPQSTLWCRCDAVQDPSKPAQVRSGRSLQMISSPPPPWPPCAWRRSLWPST